ncbi:MAG: amino acid ABC transporter substrate-binding protein [Pseudomonas sp.]|uniref:amino acid ABC transporter substrate-binding protein n=1 Tax=Pseudomonas sp. TaxID=306 RepID=UPI003BB75339
MHAVFLTRAATALLLLSSLLPLAGHADTLQRIRSSNSFTLGFVPGDAPFSDGDSIKAQGYAIDLCRQVGERLKQQLALPDLQLRYQPLTVADMLNAVSEGRVDIVCSSVVETLKRREQVSFSLPIFTAGLGVIVRKDAPPSLMAPLEGKALAKTPVWRATINQGLNRHSFAVQADTVNVDWARNKIRQLGLQSKLIEVKSSEEGVAMVASGKVDAFLADRLVLLNYQARHPQRDQLLVPEHLFDVMPIAMPLARDDEDFRLQVDSALSALYRSAAIEPLYRGYFGEPTEQTRLLLRLYSRP